MVCFAPGTLICPYTTEGEPGNDSNRAPTPRLVSISTSRSALRFRFAGSAATLGIARNWLNCCTNSDLCVVVYSLAASTGVCAASAGANDKRHSKRRSATSLTGEIMATLYSLRLVVNVAHPLADELRLLEDREAAHTR